MDTSARETSADGDTPSRPTTPMVGCKALNSALSGLLAAAQAAHEGADLSQHISSVVAMLTPEQKELLVAGCGALSGLASVTAQSPETVQAVLAALLPEGPLLRFMAVTTPSLRAQLAQALSASASSAADGLRATCSDGERPSTARAVPTQGTQSNLLSMLRHGVGSLSIWSMIDRKRLQGTWAQAMGRSLPQEQRMHIINSINAVSNAHLNSVIISLGVGFALFITMLVIGLVRVGAACSHALAPLNIAFGSVGLLIHLVLALLATMQRRTALRLVRALQSALDLDTGKKMPRSDLEDPTRSEDSTDMNEAASLMSRWQYLQLMQARVVGLGCLGSLVAAIIAASMAFDDMSGGACDALLTGWTRAWAAGYLSALGLALCAGACGFGIGMSVIAMMGTQPSFGMGKTA